MLPEHVTVVHPSHLPWELKYTASQPTYDYLDQALIYNWLDQANMYHVLMETGNFIYATACKLLNACSHASSHYQILATVSEHKHKGRDPHLPPCPLPPSIVLSYISSVEHMPLPDNIQIRHALEGYSFC